MTFLFPMMLGGLALIGVPIVLHLLMRQKPKTLLFPAFRFLVQRRKSNQRKLRLRQILLLALRVLLIAAIVLAVAQPKLFNDALQLAAQRPSAVVLLFDTSSSMDYRSNENHSRLEEAKRLANELLDQLSPTSRIIVLDSAEERKLTDKSWLSCDDARKVIQQLKLRPANAPVTAWLKEVYSLFERKAKDADPEVKRMPRLLCLFSDRTAACWEPKDVPGLVNSRNAVSPPLEQLQQVHGTIPELIGLLGSLRQRLPPANEQAFADQILLERLESLRNRVPLYSPQDYPDESIRDLVAGTRVEAHRLADQLQKFEAKDDAREYRDKLVGKLRTMLRDLRGVREIFFDVGVEKPIDRAIVDLHFPEKPRGGGERLVFGPQETFDLRVLVQATGVKLNANVECQVGDKSLQSKAAAGDAGQTVEVVFSIDCKDLGPGTHSLRVALKGQDAHAATNQRFATFSVRQPRLILVVAEKSNQTGAYFWKKAIEARRDTLLGCEILEPETVLKDGPAALARFKAIFLYQVAQPSEDLWRMLGSYVNRGGGLGVLLGGKELVKPAYASVEAKKLLPGEPRNIIDSPKTDGGVELNWDDKEIYKHSLLHLVGLWKEGNDADFIVKERKAFHYWEVHPNLGARTLLAYADKKQRPVLLERPRDPKTQAGPVLLLTTPVDNRKPPWNNFMEDETTFCVVLPGLCANYLAGDPEEVRLNFTARSGQAPVVPLPLEDRADTYQLVADLLTVQPTGDKNARDPVRRNESVDGNISRNDKNELLLPQATEPGNYTLRIPEPLRTVARFSVNTPPEEADLTRVPLTDLEALFGIDSVVTIDQDRALADVLVQQWGEPLELFPYLMVLLLFLLALENLLANKFYRREPEVVP